MLDNPTLALVRGRRSAYRFDPDPIDPEALDAALEAARWAPSARNSQPWAFVVVEDPETRSHIGTILRSVTWSWSGFSAAPVMVLVAVDTTMDPGHHVEDGAVAAQNLCLAAHSLGLGSSWAGVYSPGRRRGSAQRALLDLVGLPSTHRVVAVVPIGRASHIPEGTRRPLDTVVHSERYRPQPAPALDDAAQEDVARAPASAAAPGPQPR